MSVAHVPPNCAAAVVVAHNLNRMDGMRRRFLELVSALAEKVQFQGYLKLMLFSDGIGGMDNAKTALESAMQEKKAGLSDDEVFVFEGAIHVASTYIHLADVNAKLIGWK